MQPILRTCTTEDRACLHIARCTYDHYATDDGTLCGLPIWYMPPTTHPETVCTSCTAALLNLPNVVGD